MYYETIIYFIIYHRLRSDFKSTNETNYKIYVQSNNIFRKPAFYLYVQYLFKTIKNNFSEKNNFNKNTNFKVIKTS